jgi:hypothetical protein
MIREAAKILCGTSSFLCFLVAACCLVDQPSQAGQAMPVDALASVFFAGGGVFFAIMWFGTEYL